jgi:hypothetical protein
MIGQFSPAYATSSREASLGVVLPEVAAKAGMQVRIARWGVESGER